MPGAYAPDFLQTNAASLADDDAPEDNGDYPPDQGMSHTPPGAGAPMDPASPVTLVGNPGSGPPSMPAPKGARPDVPRGPNAVPSAPAPGRAAAPAGGGGFQLDDDTIASYKEVLRQKFPGMDEKKLNALADYGVAKRRGQMAAKNKKLLAKPLGQYFGALSQEANARGNVEVLKKSMESKLALATDPTTGEVDPKYMPYQDKIDAAIMRAEQAAQKRQQLQQHLGKYGVKPEYLENQITLMEFMRQLAGGDPAQNDIDDDDPMDVFGDEQSDQPDQFNPSAGLLQ